MQFLKPKQIEEYRAVFEQGGSKSARPTTASSRGKAANGGAQAPAESSVRATQPSQEQTPTVSYCCRSGVSLTISSIKIFRLPFQRQQELADESEVPEFTCQFCGMYDEAFTEEGLDLHYWQDCLMLAACGQCGQVIEVSCLNDHLLTECDFKVGQSPLQGRGRGWMV